MQLSPGRFNGLLRSMGQDVLWRGASMCPCRNPISGAAAQGCPVCDGRGWSWGAGAPAWAGVTGQRVNKEWAAYGQWQSGDQVLSIGSDSPLYAVAENDRIIMVNSSVPFNSIVKPGVTRLPWTVVASIASVHWLTPDGTASVQGGLPLVDASGNLSWPLGRLAPPPTAQYVVAGRAKPEFFIFREYPQDRAHHAGAPLPRRVVARRWDLFGRV